MNDKRQSWIGQIAQAWIVRAMEGESKIQEQIQHGPQTKSKLQLAQWLGVLLGIVGAGAGLWLIGDAIGDAFKLEMKLGDYGLMGAVIVLAVTLTVGGIRQLLAGMDEGLQVIGTVLVLLFAFAVAAAAAANMSLIQYAELTTGTGLVIASLALTRHQLQELMDPMGRSSALERMVRPYFPVIFGVDEEPDPQYTDPIPHRMKGRTTLTSAANGQQQAPPWAFDLLDFISRAEKVGLSRDGAWLKPGKPKYKLPSGTRVTRGVYDTMLEKMSLYEWVQKDGDKDAWQWRPGMNPALARELLEAEIARIEGDHPPTDPRQPGS